MNISGDELAGIAGMFGGLRRDELVDACVELEYKESGERPDGAIVQDTIDAAIESYRLVCSQDEEYLIPGPTAFPTLPPFAEDLHYILEVTARDIDRAAPAERIVRSLESELDGEVSEERRMHIEQLSYDLEAWADVDATCIRTRAAGADEPET